MQYQAQIKRKYSLEEIARAVGGEISGGQVRAPGPGHSTKDRSLSIKLAADGDFIIHSFANDDAMECRDYVRERLGEPQWKPNGGHDPVTASYVYQTEDGKPYLSVQRTASKRFWQQHFDGSGWQPGAPKGARIPYRLPDLLAAETVYFVEGEKDADRLADLGYVATTVSGGAKSKWVPEFDPAFASKTIYIIPDNDEPGEEFATSFVVAGADRIGDDRENDRNSAGRLQQWRHCVGANSHDDVRPERDQFHRIFANEVRVGSTHAGVDADVSAIDPAQLLQPLQEGR